MKPTWCEINLDNLVYNYRNVRKVVGERVKVISVVKADAYGHGAVECSKALASCGADYFAVARVSEGVELRRAGISCPILILGYIPDESIPDVFRYDLTPTIYNVDFARKLSDSAHTKVKVHIKIDTGMGRLGFRGVEESIQAVEKVISLKNILVEGIYSHFSNADEEDKGYSYRQVSIFSEILEGLEKKGIYIPLKHISNSAAILDLPDSYFNCVRPGIVLYGLYPSEYVKMDELRLKPVKSFKTTVTNVKTVQKGESISYGRKYIADSDRIVATLAAGYADGYSRLLSNKGEVLIRGSRAKILGTVCMDQCMADITDIPDVKIGDEVLLYGPGLPIEEVAEKMGTINYEVACMTKSRVPMRFISKK